MFNSAPPFGHQQQSVFGQKNSIFAPKPFGTPTTPFASQAAGSIFSGTSTGNFGGGTQAFSLPAFGNPASAPVSSVPSFGTPTFSPAFGTSSFAGTSIFGQKPAFNANTPAFGTPTTPAFSTPTTPGLGTQPTAPAFGTPTTPCFSTPSPFGTQSSSLSFQTATPSTFGTPGTFGQPGFGQQKSGGSRAVAYAPTVLEDTTLGTGKLKLHSISFMPVNAQKSHDELRWEDYQLGDKGGRKWATPQPNPSGIIQPNPFNSKPTNANPFGLKTTGFPSSTPSNPFATGTSLTSTNLFNQPSTPAFTPYNFGTTSSTTPSTAPSPFNSTPGAANPFSTTRIFQQPNNVFNQPTTPPFSPFNFGTTPSSTHSTTPNTFGLTIGVPPKFQQTNNALGQFSSSAFAPVSTTSAPLTSTVGTQNTGFWNSSLNSTPGTTNTFGLTIGVPPTFQQTNNALGKFSSSPFAPVSTTSSCAPLMNTVGTQNSGFWNNPFNSTPSQTSWNNTVIGQTNPSPQTQPAFSFPNSGQQQQPAVGGYNVSTGVGVASSGFNSLPNSFGQNTFPQPPTQPSVVAMNPFGTLPAMPQISIGHTRAAPSIQYGISKMPVIDKVAPVRVSSLMTSRYLSQRRIRLPAKSSCSNDCTRVPFFSDHVEAPSTPKADALFIPRENPRVFVICPPEHWTSRTSSEQSKDTNNTPLHENGKLSEKASGSGLNGSINHEKHTSNPLLAENGHAKERTDIETLMPKLRYPDYYTEPQIQELAAKERAEPGFCGRVQDFIVGRHGFGSIEFAGETDVRNLDLECLVQFNNREVIVYLDDSKKPPVGQGLNKAAVVTLLNIKCFDKKTGQQYLEGVKVEKYKELLMKKTVDQDAEFVSYDPIKGEWKFRVNRF